MAHGAVASKVLGETQVDAVLGELSTAPIAEPLRAVLGFLRQVTVAHETITAADVEPLLALGITRTQIESALNVAWAFNVITRLADTFEFQVGPKEAFEAAAKILLTRGYKL
jgi:alkylhydroperoxidase family enzyme